MNYVIGNIEGRYKLFCALLKQAKFDNKIDKLYILGDFIGNSYDTVNLIEYIMSNTKKKIFFPIIGDKEEMFIEAIQRNNIAIEEKLLSEKGLLYIYYDNQKLRRTHIKFFESLPKYIETEQFVFSHFGKKTTEPIFNIEEHSPKVEKSEKKHIYSHFNVNKLAPGELIYSDKENNAVCINKNVNDYSYGGLLLLNLDMQKSYFAKDTVI